MKDVTEQTFTILKTPKGYLRDVWEEWEEDVINYDFTDDPRRAMKFYGSKDSAPKYMWDFKKKKSIDTLKETCEYLDGKLVTIELTITAEWKES